MKLILCIGWACILIVFICISNLNAFLHHHVVHFHFVAEPDFTKLLVTRDTHFTDSSWLFIKFGHFAGFAILGLLLFNCVKKYTLGLAALFLFAAVTEVMQLYFSRDGRFVDVGIDSAGVMLSYFVRRTSKSIT